MGAGVALETKVDQIREIIAEKSVELLHLQFVDIEGTLKHITVTTEQFEDVIEGR